MVAKKVQFNEFVSWNTKYIVELMKNLVTFILLFWKNNILNMILGIHLTKMKCLKSISCVNLFNIEMYLIVKLTLTEAISHILRTTVTDIRMRFFKHWKIENLHLKLVNIKNVKQFKIKQCGFICNSKRVVGGC